MILVTNRDYITNEKFMKKSIHDKYIHINILDMWSEPEVEDFTGHRIDYLSMKFDDLSINYLRHIKVEFQEEYKELLYSDRIFNSDKARAILNFIEKNGGINNINIIINCSAGLSRSVGTAIGVLHYYGIDHTNWIDSGDLISNTAKQFRFPNDLVMKTFKDLAKQKDSL